MSRYRQPSCKEFWKATLIAMLVFQRGDLVGNLPDPLFQIRLGTVVDFPFAKTIARYMQLKLGLEFLALGVEMFEMAVSHCEPRFR